MEHDYNLTVAASPDHAQTVLEHSDPVATVLETTARLRVLERLLQRALAPETATGERSALLCRYNGQRQELFARIDDALTGQMQPTPTQLHELIAGPLPLDCTDTALVNAVVNVHRIIDLLGIC